MDTKAVSYTVQIETTMDILVDVAMRLLSHIHALVLIPSDA
jgi:hypothetical protein